MNCRKEIAKDLMLNAKLHQNAACTKESLGAESVRLICKQLVYLNNLYLIYKMIDVWYRQIWIHSLYNFLEKKIWRSHILLSIKKDFVSITDKSCHLFSIRYKWGTNKSEFSLRLGGMGQLDSSVQRPQFFSSSPTFLIWTPFLSTLVEHHGWYAVTCIKS